MKINKKNMKYFVLLALLFCYNANANLGLDLDLNKKDSDLTPEQQEEKQMGEVFCEYCSKGWVEKRYELTNQYKKERGEKFKGEYQHYIDRCHELADTQNKKEPGKFDQFDEPSCKFQSLQCINYKSVPFKNNSKVSSVKMADNKLSQTPVPKYCFATFVIPEKGIPNYYRQIDCEDTAVKEAKKVKNERSHDRYVYQIDDKYLNEYNFDKEFDKYGDYISIVENCYQVYNTSNRKITFLAPQEKQKYIDLMGYCAKQVGDYLRSEGAII